MLKIWAQFDLSAVLSASSAILRLSKRALYGMQRLSFAFVASAIVAYCRE